MHRCGWASSSLSTIGDGNCAPRSLLFHHDGVYPSSPRAFHRISRSGRYSAAVLGFLFRHDSAPNMHHGYRKAALTTAVLLGRVARQRCSDWFHVAAISPCCSQVASGAPMLVTVPESTMNLLPPPPAASGLGLSSRLIDILGAHGLELAVDFFPA